MGMGGDVNGCGLCAKYCLFAANFVIFVSGYFELSFIAWNNILIEFIQLVDWCIRFTGTGHMDSG